MSKHKPNCFLQYADCADNFKRWSAAETDADADTDDGAEADTTEADTSDAPAGIKEEQPSQTPLHTARNYLARGWKPVPIGFRKKKPYDDEWQNVIVDDNNIAALFNKPKMNVGVRLGPRSGGLTDIDLDCGEAIALARYLLPPTHSIFGRRSTPVSHLLYNIQDAPNKAVDNFKDADGGSIIELRMGGGVKGGQTVFPGSVHVSGEAITWVEDGEPARSTHAELLAAVKQIAVGTILMRVWPNPKHSAHDHALAVGGILARGGWDAAAIEKLVLAVTHTAGNSSYANDNARSAMGAVAVLASGGNVYGFPKLKELIGEEPAKAIGKIMDYGTKESPDDVLVLDPSNPIHSARALMATTFTNPDGLNKLHRHRGAFWQWTESFYRLADDETIRSEFWTFLEKSFRLEKKSKDGPWETVPFKPNRARVGDAIDALNAVTQLDKYIEPPAWLTTTDMPPPIEFLACANGLLHLPSGEMYPPTPDYFNISASSVHFNLDAPRPCLWLALLDEVFENDNEAKELLQDWFGYVLSPDTCQQKILLMVGPKRSGKGTIGRILTAVLGRDAVAGPTMSSLAETFGLEPLITKPLAIISDARIGARTDKSVIVERLLSISGEDPLTVARKFIGAWTGKLPTRFTILTNELPSLNDGSGALAGRFIILIMTKSFFGKEDPALTSKLMPELPGILNWAIEGYRRLRGRGYFVQPQSSYEAADDIEMLAAPVRAFLRDCCDIEPGLEISIDGLWVEWKSWSAAQGRPDAGNKLWFGRNLRSAVPGLRIVKKRIDGGGDRREQVYVGIALKPDGEFQ